MEELKRSHFILYTDPQFPGSWPFATGTRKEKTRVMGQVRAIAVIWPSGKYEPRGYHVETRCMHTGC